MVTGRISPVSGGKNLPDQAAAWLLRINRRLGHHDRLARLAAFASYFQGGCWDRAADQSKISRWETGAVRAPYLAVRRYEELLDLPEQSLVAVVNVLHRYYAPAIRSRSALPRPEPTLTSDLDRHNRLGETLDKVRSRAVVTGAEWDELTSFLAATPEGSPLPLTTWSRLSERLLMETVIASDLPWLLRFESLSRLLAHPVAGPYAVAACAALGADPTNQVFIDPLSALDASDHPDAGRHALRQLHNPTNDRAFTGALLACVRKSRYGHFGEDSAHRLAALLRELVTDQAAAPATRRLAAQVLHNLAGHPRTRNLVDPTELAGAVRLLTPRRLLAPPVAAAVVTRVLAKVQASEPIRSVDLADEALPTLLDELLSNPMLDIRLYVSVLLRASPYRQALAAALVSELRRPHALADLPLALSLLSALRVVGDRRHAVAVQALVSVPGVPDPVRETAAYSVGHIEPEPAEPFWQQAISLHSRRWVDGRDATSGNVLEGLVYGLGVAGDDALLGRLRDAEVPTPARAAARWWTGLPAEIRASARR
jgi:hypothetical protein